MTSLQQVPHEAPTESKSKKPIAYVPDTKHSLFSFDSPDVSSLLKGLVLAPQKCKAHASKKITKRVMVSTNFLPNKVF